MHLRLIYFNFPINNLEFLSFVFFLLLSHSIFVFFISEKNKEITCLLIITNQRNIYAYAC